MELKNQGHQVISLVSGEKTSFHEHFQIRTYVSFMQNQFSLPTTVFSNRSVFDQLQKTRTAVPFTALPL